MAEFNAEPYWDDFDATNGALEKNYMRILFRPGYAVQARELTQIQSILQNQIKQFGDHIFQDGSPVIGGHLTLDTSISYVKLDKQFNGQDIDLEDFFGIPVFSTGSPKIRARVIQTYSTSEDRALLVKYIRGTSFNASQTIQTAANNRANVISSGATGIGSVVSINQGVFYVDGFFVTVAPQTIVLEPYSATPSYRVGLQIDEEIVTESVDNALLDPAQEAFNYQAPGAHRYQFALVLAKRALDSVDDSRFFELLRVENGVITRQVSYPIYSELEKTLARRTYDESGNYAVKPFRINLSANTPIGASENTSTYIINIEPGKAYVKGFEFETIGTTKVSAFRARNTKSNKDYDLSAYYGNRILVANTIGSSVNGIVFSDNLDELDIHCVANNQVDVSGSSAKYYSTRIGSAKLRNIERTSATNEYYLYLTDINFTPIVATANGNSANTNSIRLPAHFSSTNDAYVGGTITMIDQIAGETATITDYDGASGVAVLNKDFSQTVVSAQRFSLSMPVGSAESVRIANTTSFTSANLQANVAATGKNAIGNAIIEDSSFNKMVFELPNYYVKYDSDVNVDVYKKTILKNQSFASNGACTISSPSSTDTFDFGTNGSTISSADVKENIIVVATSGSNAGKIADLTSGSASVYRTTSQSITLNTDSFSGASFTGDVYVTTKITNANGTTRRVKTLIRANDALTTGDTLGSAADVLGYTSVKVNASNGIAWFTAANVISTIPGESQSLFVSDVVKIRKIYDSTNISHAPNTTNMVDITDRYNFDSGQTDNYYNHASITLKPGSQPPKGQTAVLFDYFTHTGSGYISAKSYASTLYETEQIPIYKSLTGKNYALRDCIDVRPIRISGLSVAPFKTTAVSGAVNVASGGVLVQANTALAQNVISPPITTGTIIKIGSEYKTVNSVINLQAVTVSSSFSSSASDAAVYVVDQNYDFTGSIIQRPTDPIELDYEYYLPRIDKLVVTKDKEFKVLTGVPSLKPQPPAENDSSMAFYTIYVPPYTASLSSIDLSYIDNRRYTMKDISELDTRISKIEGYISLKESEREIISDPPKSPQTPTINKPIYGTLVDDFNDLTVADTFADFAASIENGGLTCYKNITTFSLKYPDVASPPGGDRDKFVTLPYTTEVPFAEQKLSSTDGVETVQPTMIAKFEGFVTLTPESDFFYSLEHQPAITDTFGRFFELRQTTPTSDPALTSTVIENVGAGQYIDTTYINAIIAGQNIPTSISATINAPHYALNIDSASNPSVTTPININVFGVAPDTLVNNSWTGPGGTLSMDTANYNPFGQEWFNNGFFTASNFGRFDDV